MRTQLTIVLDIEHADEVDPGRVMQRALDNGLVSMDADEVPANLVNVLRATVGTVVHGYTPVDTAADNAGGGAP